MSPVTTVTPMKRGLKAPKPIRPVNRRVSYNRYPDEKGTERTSPDQYYQSPRGYNRYPDEKGTERLWFFLRLARFSLVTTVTPMKRGLKESQGLTGRWWDACYNRYPDEKGTES